MSISTEQALRATLITAIQLADAVEQVIQSQTNVTIDTIGLPKMKAQKQALDAFRKSIKELPPCDSNS